MSSDEPAVDTTIADEPAVVDTSVLDPTWPIAAARAADDKKAHDIVVLRVGEVLALTDFFVIASASNPRLVKAVVDEIEEQLHILDGPRPVRAEGLDNLDWVLVDYGEFVVHVFAEDVRHYYELERLWSDVQRVEWRPDDHPDLLSSSTADGS